MKSQNVLLSRNWDIAKIADAGVARFAKAVDVIGNEGVASESPPPFGHRRVCAAARSATSVAQQSTANLARPLLAPHGLALSVLGFQADHILFASHTQRSYSVLPVCHAACLQNTGNSLFDCCRAVGTFAFAAPEMLLGVDSGVKVNTTHNDCLLLRSCRQLHLTEELA